MCMVIPLVGLLFARRVGYVCTLRLSGLSRPRIGAPDEPVPPLVLADHERCSTTRVPSYTPVGTKQSFDEVSFDSQSWFHR